MLSDPYKPSHLNMILSDFLWSLFFCKHLRFPRSKSPQFFYIEIFENWNMFLGPLVIVKDMEALTWCSPFLFPKNHSMKKYVFKTKMILFSILYILLWWFYDNMPRSQKKARFFSQNLKNLSNYRFFFRIKVVRLKSSSRMDYSYSRTRYDRFKNLPPTP